MRNVFSWRLKVLTESIRRSGDGRLFQARGAATANERSPSDDVVRGTATEPDMADLEFLGYSKLDLLTIAWAHIVCFALPVT